MWIALCCTIMLIITGTSLHYHEKDKVFSATLPPARYKYAQLSHLILSSKETIWNDRKKVWHIWIKWKAMTRPVVGAEIIWVTSSVTIHRIPPAHSQGVSRHKASNLIHMPCQPLGGGKNLGQTAQEDSIWKC